jgi:S-adenosylhomocysteine hydrolase
MILPGADGCKLLVDDGSDATCGFARLKSSKISTPIFLLPDPSNTDRLCSSASCNCRRFPSQQSRQRIAYGFDTQRCQRGDHHSCAHLKKMAAKTEWLLPAINVNDCVTKSMFEMRPGAGIPCLKKMVASVSSVAVQRCCLRLRLSPCTKLGIESL